MTHREDYALAGDGWKVAVILGLTAVLYAPRIAVAAERFVCRAIDRHEFKIDQAAGDR